jgi:hypothetical protein
MRSNRIIKRAILFVSLFFIYLPSVSQTIDDILKKPRLKVLDIGNSYTQDATYMLKLLTKVNQMDVSDMCLYVAIRGGGSFKSWYDVYHDSDHKTYYISKVIGGINANISTGTGEPNDGALFREVLTNETWDIIIINPHPKYAPYYDKWKETEDYGCLNEFLSVIKKYQPRAKIGFLLVHSYWDHYGANTEKSSLLRWELIANSVKSLCEEYPIDLVIPYGTAIENLRSSSINNECDLTRDGVHCGFGLARYTAACCYYESLLAPRSGITIIGNTARYDASNDESAYPAISVTDDNALIAQWAAVLATKNYYECVNPEDVMTSIDNLDDSTFPRTDNTFIYNVAGNRIKTYQHGINIVKLNNVKTIKIIK